MSDVKAYVRIAINPSDKNDRTTITFQSPLHLGDLQLWKTCGSFIQGAIEELQRPPTPRASRKPSALKKSARASGGQSTNGRKGR